MKKLQAYQSYNNFIKIIELYEYKVNYINNRIHLWKNNYGITSNRINDFKSLSLFMQQILLLIKTMENKQ